jgi:transposase
MEAKRNTSKRYPPEVKERAVRLVGEGRAEDPKDVAAIGGIAQQLGVGPESLRQWVKQAEIDAGKRAGLTTDEQARLKALEEENRELKRFNKILRRASAFLAARLDRPQK